VCHEGEILITVQVLRRLKTGEKIQISMNDLGVRELPEQAGLRLAMIQSSGSRRGDAEYEQVTELVGEVYDRIWRRRWPVRIETARFGRVTVPAPDVHELSGI